METVSVLLAIYEGNPLVTDGFPRKGPLLLTWFNFNPSMDM